MLIQNKKQSVALSSVFASAFLTITKLIAGLATGSMGILSEAAHSALDFGAALLTYFAVCIGDKPADTKHTYGHGKAESVSALAETGLLFITSAWIIYEAVRRLQTHNLEVEVAWYSFAVIIFSIIIDYSRSKALSKVAKETKSQALEADALHFSSDILSSLVVLLGLVFVSFGIKIADPIAAVGVSLFVTRAGISLGKRTIDVLIDAVPEGLTEKIIETTKKVTGVIGIEKLRVRSVGAIVFVDMTINVNRKLPLQAVQNIINNIEGNIHKIIAEADITVHTKPLSLDNETIIERIQIIATNHNLAVHDIAVHSLKDKKYISFDLEVDANLTILEAHKTASHLEKEIMKELGDNIEIDTHIEPFRSQILTGVNISADKELEIQKIISKIAKTMKLVVEIHDIEIRKTQEKLFISFHALFENDTPLEEVHNFSSRFEYLIKDEVPNVHRVVVHAEPINLKKKAINKY